MASSPEDILFGTSLDFVFALRATNGHFTAFFGVGDIFHARQWSTEDLEIEF